MEIKVGQIYWNRADKVFDRVVKINKLDAEVTLSPVQVVTNTYYTTIISKSQFEENLILANNLIQLLWN